MLQEICSEYCSKAGSTRTVSHCEQYVCGKETEIIQGIITMSEIKASNLYYWENSMIISWYFLFFWIIL